MTAAQSLHEAEQKYLKEKKWAPIEGELSFQRALERMTKADLDQVRRFANISGVSQLTKPQLIAHLAERHEELFHYSAQLLDRGHYAILQKAAKEGHVDVSPFQTKRMEWWRKSMLFSSGTIGEQFVLVMPKEYRVFVQEFETNFDAQRVLKENEQLIHAAKGLLDYYGVMPIYDLLGQLETLGLMNTRLNVKTSLDILTTYQSLEEYFQEGPGWFADPLVLNPEDMLGAINKRTDLDYATFSKEHFVAVGAKGELPKSKDEQRFEKFISKIYQIPKIESQEILDELKMDIRNELTYNETMQNLARNFEFETKEEALEFASYVTKVINTTPRWILKGHTPNDLSRGNAKQEIENTTPTAGRNDPCPCGSGKKFKKCCGR